MSPEFTRDAIKDVDASWPKSGEIVLQNVNAQYRDGLPKVLKSIDLNIGAGTKVEHVVELVAVNQHLQSAFSG